METRLTLIMDPAVSEILTDEATIRVIKLARCHICSSSSTSEFFSAITETLEHNLEEIL